VGDEWRDEKENVGETRQDAWKDYGEGERNVRG